jgi:hypothetical protein
MGARLLARLLPTACLRVRIDIYQKTVVGRSLADPGYLDDIAKETEHRYSCSPKNTRTKSFT